MPQTDAHRIRPAGPGGASAGRAMGAAGRLAAENRFPVGMPCDLLGVTTVFIEHNRAT